MAKCPDCGSNSIIHWPGTLECIANQMPEEERRRNKALAMEVLKKVATFVGVTFFLISLMGFDNYFLILIGGILGYVLGSSRFQKYYHVQGFFDGCIARHQGRGVPAEYAEIYTPETDVAFLLSAAERELLKNPDERSWRRLPPLKDGK